MSTRIINSAAADELRLEPTRPLDLPRTAAEIDPAPPNPGPCPTCGQPRANPVNRFATGSHGAAPAPVRLPTDPPEVTHFDTGLPVAGDPYTHGGSVGLDDPDLPDVTLPERRATQPAPAAPAFGDRPRIHQESD